MTTTFIEKFRAMCAEQAERDADPLLQAVQDLMLRVEDGMASTAAILSWLGLRNTTGNARRLAQTMKSLPYVPIQSKRFLPGGYRNTVTRGYAKTVRPLRRQASPVRAAKNAHLLKQSPTEGEQNAA